MTSSDPNKPVALDALHTYRCAKCNKKFGKTLMTLYGVSVWVGCDCMDDSLVYMVNPEHLEDTKEVIQKIKELNVSE